MFAIVLPLVNAVEYFVGYSLAISKCWRIFCWLLSCHWLMLENILLPIVMALVNAGDYFAGYCLANSENWRIVCWLLSCH